MSRKTVYEGLKKALLIKKLPYANIDDGNYTLTFDSWKQFQYFDKLLSSINTTDDIKLCIYAEKVKGNSDGVAVTVSDEVQHLTYWSSYFNMHKRVEIFEEFISKLLRKGILLLAYDYKNFSLLIYEDDFNKIKIDLERNKQKYLINNASYSVAHPNWDAPPYEPQKILIDIEFPEYFDTPFDGG